MLDSKSVSPDYVSTRRNLIKNHVIDLLTDDIKVSKIDLNYLELIQTNLVKKNKLSNTTINQIMGSISLSLEYAKKINLLNHSIIIKS